MSHIFNPRQIVDRRALAAAIEAAAQDATPDALRATLLDLVKRAQKDGIAAIRTRFEAGTASGAETVAAHSYLMDQIIRVLFDAVTRYLVRSGVRTTGERLVSGKYSDTVNWAKPGLNAKGAPVRDPAKDYDVAGSLISPANGGITNWPPPAFSPETGLFIVPQNDSYAMYYLTETDPRGAMGLGGKEEAGLGTLGSYITAIDYKTGKIAWRHRFPGTGGGGAQGLLTTAGKLLFGGDLGGNIVAYNPANGTPLWHSHIGQVTNAPETYMLDGRQYILIATGDTLYAFNLY